MDRTIIAAIVSIVIIAWLSVLAFGPVYFAWKDEKAVKKASGKYVKRFGGQDGR